MDNQIQSLPKYYQLKKILMEEMKELTPGSRLPSEAELMKKYNVSYITVYKTKLELLREGLINTVQGKGCFLADLGKKNMHKGTLSLKSKRIAFIMTGGKNNNYFYSILTGMMKYFQKKGYNLEIYNSDGNYSKEINLLGRCVAAGSTRHQFAGLIFMPKHYDGEYKHILKLQKDGIPVVLIGRHLKNYNLDWVGLDNIKASKKAVGYLIESGHKKIVFLGWEKNNSTAQNRLEGYKQALMAKNIEVNPELILECSNFSENGGYERFKSFLSQKIDFTSVFAFGDDMAAGAYRALIENNLKVPEDVSLIGFDDSEKARNLAVPLTTVWQDVPKLGYYAAKMLCERIENKSLARAGSSAMPEKRVLPTKLVIRDSVKKLG